MACITREAFFCGRRVQLCGRKLHFNVHLVAGVACRFSL
jgi:hypothetical protein